MLQNHRDPERLKIFSAIRRGEAGLTDRKGEGREHIGTTVVSHFILVQAHPAPLYTPLWEFGSGGPGSHGVALLSHSRVSSFVCNSFAGCTAHAHRAPAQALYVCTDPLRVYVRAPTRRPTVHEYKGARVGFETKTRQTEKVEENERTGEARISPCKANLFACIETEYRLKPSVTT